MHISSIANRGTNAGASAELTRHILFRCCAAVADVVIMSYAECYGDYNYDDDEHPECSIHTDCTLPGSCLYYTLLLYINNMVGFLFVNHFKAVGVKYHKTLAIFNSLVYIYCMERRKLQATGGSSLTLTLPKLWTSHWNLQSKDEVLIKPSGTSLVIKPANKAKQEIAIDISIDQMPEEWVLREMIGAYISGADKIMLQSQRISPSQNQVIRRAVQLFFGFEILEETSQKIVARSVLDDAMFPVSESTMRIFMITRGMFEDSLKAAQTGDKELAADIKLRDYEVNKFLHAIQRQFQQILSGKVEGNIEEVSFYRSVAIQLERVGDHAVKIAELASADRTATAKLSTTFPTIQERVHQLLKEVEGMVRHIDKQQAHRLIDSGKDLEKLFYSSKRMKQSYEGAIIEDSLDRLRGYLMNIAEFTIDYAVGFQQTL